MRYEDFVSVNKTIRANDFNNMLQKATIEEFDKVNDMCLVRGDQFYDWISTSWVVKTITTDPFYYLTNSSKIKDWKGWTK